MRSRSGRTPLLFAVIFPFAALAGEATSIGEPSLDSLAVRSTLLARGTGEARELVLEVEVKAGGAAGPGTLSASYEGRTMERTIEKVEAGVHVYELGVPVPGAPADGTFTLRARGAERSARARVAPPRPFTAYLVHFSHTDIGYTDRQAKVFQEHRRFLEEVLELCAATDSFPEDSKFRWTCETVWQVENFLSGASPAAREAFLARIKEGRIEVTGLYLNLLTGLSSGEELCRAVYGAGRLRKDLGIPIESAMSSDVTGYTWALPAVLASAGIRYFSTAVNVERAKRPNPPVERIFEWQSPGGAGVLVFLSRDQYQEGNTAGFIESFEKTRQKFPKYLEVMASEGYPYEEVLLRTPGRIGDNTPPELKISQIAREWNERYSNPRVVVATCGQFFRKVAERHKKFPVYRKEWTDWWADGAASSARETALVRRAQDRIAAAEALAAAALARDPAWAYPRVEIDSVYRDILFYDEHTWGAAASVTEPESPMTRDQWEWKAACAARAAAGAEAVHRRAAEAFAAPLRRAGSRLVVNPLPWTRDGAPEAAGRIPSLGWALFKGEAGGASAVEVGEDSIESPFYRVRLNVRRTAIASILDKRIGRELLDPESPFGGAEVLYVKGNDRAKPLRPAEGRVAERSAGAGRGKLVFETKGEKARRISVEAVLYGDLPRLDLEVRIDKEPTLEKEGIYIAFPFAPAGARVRCELAGGAMTPEADQLPKAARDWIAIHRWVTVNSPGLGIAWSSPDAPLVELGAIHTNEFLDRLEIPRPLVLSYVMNNYWTTNYKASQGGEHVFRYAITSAPEMDDLAAARMSREHATPLLREGPGGIAGDAGESGSLLSLEDPSKLAMILTWKRAEDGDGFIVRILDFGAGEREGLLRTAWPIRSAWLADVLEEPRAELAASGDTARVPLKGPGFVTVRLRLRR